MVMKIGSWGSTGGTLRFGLPRRVRGIVISGPWGVIVYDTIASSHGGSALIFFLGPVFGGGIRLDELDVLLDELVALLRASLPAQGG